MMKGIKTTKRKGAKAPEEALTLKGSTARYGNVSLTVYIDDGGEVRIFKSVTTNDGKILTGSETGRDVDFVSTWMAWLLLGGRIYEGRAQ